MRDSKIIARIVSTVHAGVNTSTANLKPDDILKLVGRDLESECSELRYGVYPWYSDIEGPVEEVVRTIEVMKPEPDDRQRDNPITCVLPSSWVQLILEELSQSALTANDTRVAELRKIRVALANDLARRSKVEGQEGKQDNGGSKL